MRFLGLLGILLLGLRLVISQVANDQEILLAIREEFKVPGWGGNSSDYCAWSGISCNGSSLVERLDLSKLRLQGNLTLFYQLKSLKWLDLSFNNFHGSIATAFGDLSALEFLDLSFNKLDGEIPVGLGKLKNLRALNLSGNFLVGVMPDELEGLQKLQDLQVFANRLTGSIPLWVGNLTHLRIFTAYENKLSGAIPEKLGSVSQLEVLNLHSNQLEGPIPENIFALEKLETLVLTQNRLTGYIPRSIGNCRQLSSIRIGHNNLIGSVPIEIGSVSSLTYFEANNNNLSGEIVPAFSRCSNLTLLNLASNGFTGSVPLEFSLLSNLQELIVYENSLSGDIPTSVLKVKNLNKLDLSHNRFSGTIPRSICSASRLQFLLLGHNCISGEIPYEIGNCTKLLELHLGSNRLSGSIPPEIGHIRNLQISLNLSFNHLQGQLPEELGRLDKLVYLDVSNNQLSGSIPSALKGMLSLIEVNFSNNHLSGPIPSFSPFQKSSSSNFLGNRGLCGEPLSISCGGLGYPSGDDSYYHKGSYRVTLAVIGTGLAVFASVAVIVLLFMMREKREAATKDVAAVASVDTTNNPVILAGDVFSENLRQAIDFEAVHKAILKETNLVSSGTFSLVYKAEMPSGVVVSVRKLVSMDKSILSHRNKMAREVEKLSKLTHGNLLRPIGYVFSEDGVFVLHEHFSNGTLANFLHDSPKKPEYKPDWPTRLSIAIGVAQGMAFLHHVSIIHLDISSGNVVLDSTLNPLVSQVEISRLLDPSRGTASISAVAGSFGYIPPEYAYTMQVTAPGNVYSYGVILLELLTSQLPVDEAFGEGVDLVKWVQSAPSRGETPEQILDPGLSTHSFSWRKEMLSALKVALLCTDRIPAKRPKMTKVVEMLQEIKQN